MAHTIRVSDKTYSRLKRLGKFGEDNYDTIISRALDYMEGKITKRLN